MSALKSAIVYCFTIAFRFSGLIVRGITFKYLWQWYAFPLLGLPPLAVVDSIGLMVLFDTATYGTEELFFDRNTVKLLDETTFYEYAWQSAKSTLGYNSYFLFLCAFGFVFKLLINN